MLPWSNTATDATQERWILPTKAAVKVSPEVEKMPYYMMLKRQKKVMDTAHKHWTNLQTSKIDGKGTVN